MKTKKINWGYFFIYLVLIGGIIITIFPFIWMILTSFKHSLKRLQFHQ